MSRVHSEGRTLGKSRRTSGAPRKSPSRSGESPGAPASARTRIRRTSTAPQTTRPSCLVISKSCGAATSWLRLPDYGHCPRGRERKSTRLVDSVSRFSLMSQVSVCGARLSELHERPRVGLTRQDGPGGYPGASVLPGSALFLSALQEPLDAGLKQHVGVDPEEVSDAIEILQLWLAVASKNLRCPRLIVVAPCRQRGGVLVARHQ